MRGRIIGKVVDVVLFRLNKEGLLRKKFTNDLEFNEKYRDVSILDNEEKNLKIFAKLEKDIIKVFKEEFDV